MFSLQYLGFVLLFMGITSAPSHKAYDDCSVEGIPVYDFLSYHKNKDSFKEDYAGVVAEYASTGITGVFVEKGTYLAASIKKDQIVIETTKNFPNFEEENGPIYGPIEFSTFITFECENGSSTLNFIQKVIDINNHDPYFNKESFEFKYGMGLIQGFDLTKYFTVFAMDDDLTWGRMEFEISGDLLKIERGGAVDRGDHAKITLKKDIDMPFDQEFVITATDQGAEPYRSTTAKVRLILATTDKNDVIVSPLFAKPLWSWKYDTTQEAILDSEQVALSQGFGTGLKIKQTGYEDYFETTLGDQANKEVKIELKKALSKDIIKEGRIFINLEAEFPEAKQTAKTIVMLEMV